MIKKRIIAVLMMLVLVLAAMGCGRSDNGSGNSGSQSTAGEGTAAGNSSENEAATGSDTGTGAGTADSGSWTPTVGSGEFAGKATADIKKIDDGSLLFTLTGDVVTYLNNDTDNSDAILIEFVHDGGSEPDATVQFQRSQWFFYNTGAEYSIGDWDGAYGSDDKYVAKIAGAAQYVPDDDIYRIYYFKNGFWDYGEGLVAEDRVSSIISGSVTAEEAEKLMPKYQSESEAHKDWVGTYVTSAYSNDNGYVKIAKNESGALDVSGVYNGTEFEFTAEETEAEVLGYDYGTSFTGFAEGVEMAGLEYASLSISLDYDGLGSLNLNYGNYTNDANVEIYGNYEPFRDFEKPADYNDADRFGLIFAKSDGDAQYFSPATENYGLVYDNSSRAIIFTAGNSTEYESYSYETYSLFSFDTNDCLIDTKTKYVFDSESDASKVYASWLENGYDPAKSFLVGNTIYLPFVYSGKGSSKIDALTLNNMYWYCDCNYAYYKWNDSNAIRYSYLSQPIKSEYCIYDIETALFWNGIPAGTHRSIDDTDSTLDYNNYSGELPGISLFCPDMYFTSVNYSTTRFFGRSAVTIGYIEKDYLSGDDSDYIIVTEFEFGDEEATVTQYTFEASIASMEITFDNYKNFTPKETKTHRFDMLHAVSE